jgi:hypothetical protein
MEEVELQQKLDIFSLENEQLLKEIIFKQNEEAKYYQGFY